MWLSMKNQSVIFGIGIVVLAAVLFTAGCTSVFPGGTKETPVPTPLPTPVPTAVPAETPGASSCGFTTCHGSDLACSTSAPQICTAMYQIGDKCRQYASCDTGGGGCTLVTSNPKFVNCKACAERCQIQAGPDSLAAMTCEEKC
jgi:hypothetical protein